MHVCRVQGLKEVYAYVCTRMFVGCWSSWAACDLLPSRGAMPPQTGNGETAGATAHLLLQQCQGSVGVHPQVPAGGPAVVSQVGGPVPLGEEV